MGETKMRFLKVTPRSVNGENNFMVIPYFPSLKPSSRKSQAAALLMNARAQLKPV